MQLINVKLNMPLTFDKIRVPFKSHDLRLCLLSSYSDDAHCRLSQFINLQHEGILICIEGELVKEGLLSLLKYWIFRWTTYSVYPSVFPAWLSIFRRPGAGVLNFSEGIPLGSRWLIISEMPLGYICRKSIGLFLINAILGNKTLWAAVNRSPQGCCSYRPQKLGGSFICRGAEFAYM